MSQLQRNDLIFPELSYTINGLCFQVFRELGPGLLEQHYVRALVQLLRETKIKYVEQYYIPIHFHDKFIGKRFVDILVDDKIVLEIKRGQFIPRQTIQQTHDYLKLLNLQLGIVVCFTNQGVFTKRVLNLY